MTRKQMQCPIDGCSFTGKQIGQHLRRKQDQKHRQYQDADMQQDSQEQQEQDTNQHEDEDLQDPGNMFDGNGERYVTGSDTPQKARDNKASVESFECPTCGESWQKGNKEHKCGESFNCPRCEKALRPFAQNECRCGYKLPKKWGMLVK